MKQRNSGLTLVFAIAIACPIGARANTFTYFISGEATATVTTGANSISVTLTDLYVDPNSVGLNLSGLEFTTGVTPSSATVSSSSADSVRVASGGSYTNNGTVSPGWAIALTGAVTKLDDLATGGAGPAYTIIGAPGSGGQYDAANGSIARNRPHNPFLYEIATWTLSEAGVTSATSISNVLFQFGTTDNSFTAATGGGIVGTPEPGTAGILVLGGAVLVLSLIHI